jgi:hypothetical protein
MAKKRDAGVAVLDEPTAEQVQELHATAALADRQRAEARAAVEEQAPAPPADPPPAPPLRKWKVALPGVRVLAFDAARGVHVHQDHLVVEAPDAWSACVLFARHNGIPLAKDPLTGEDKLASVHRPVAEPVRE